MNPFFERRWRDAHTRLIAYISDALQEQLPPDLVAMAEEEAVNIGAGELGQSRTPDVQISEAWPNKSAGAAVAVANPPQRPATEPIYLFIDDPIERWVEIRDQSGALITAVELLSPSNKREHWQRYMKKREQFIGSAVNLVEIDLLRQGRSVFPETAQEILRREEVPYSVCVFRNATPNTLELYLMQLREPLAAIAVPLRATDSDVVLDLQPLIDQCHERGRYHLLDYETPLRRPFSEEDEAWVRTRLKEGGLVEAA